MSDREPEPTDPHHTTLVVERLTACQGQLFAYIYSLTADADSARDVLQETNRLLWRRMGDYDATREFLPWAMAHAFNQVRAARTKHQRERLVFQEGDTLDRLSDDAAENAAAAGGDRAIALEECLQKLTTKQRALIEQFYGRGESLAEIAAADNRRENTIAVALHRLRQNLAIASG